MGKLKKRGSKKIENEIILIKSSSLNKLAPTTSRQTKHNHENAANRFKNSQEAKIKNSEKNNNLNLKHTILYPNTSTAYNNNNLNIEEGASVSENIKHKTGKNI